jgi:hypothetical protein
MSQYRPILLMQRNRIMSKEVLFKNIVVGLYNKPIKDCEIALKCSNGIYRLYVHKRPKESNFYAEAVEFYSCTGESENKWDCPELKVIPLFNVTACFDGVKHLEFNREDPDTPGYIYYPDMDSLIELMIKVKEIEREICRDYSF